MSDLSLVSTTDSPAQVEAALASRAIAKVADIPTPDPSTAVVETPAGETPDPAKAEEQERADASDAGKVLAERRSKAKEREGSIQASINQLRYEAAEEERKIAALRAERERIAAEKPVELHAVAAKPQVADFTSYDDYVEALSDWKSEQKAAALRAEFKAETAAALKARDEKAQQGTVEQQWQQAQTTASERRATFAASTPDFDPLMASIADDPQYAMSEDMLVHLTMSDVGPQLAYELAKMDAKDFRAIADLPLRPMLVKLGRLESTILSRQAAAPSTGPSAVAPSKLPPPPPKPVGGGGSASTKPLDQAGYEEYKRRRRAGEGV